MRTKQSAVVSLVALALVAGCASTSSRVVRSEFDDITVPKGMSFHASRSTIIESPTVKAGRLVYRGRLEPESLGLAMRTTLEAGGWRLISASASKRGLNQVYEKTGDSLQLLVWEELYFTYMELERTQSRTAQQSAR
jgi:hypothetical protein